MRVSAPCSVVAARSFVVWRSVAQLEGPSLQCDAAQLLLTGARLTGRRGPLSLHASVHPTLRAALRSSRRTIEQLDTHCVAGIPAAGHAIRRC